MLFKSVGICFNPVGKICVRHEVKDAIERKKAEPEVQMEMQKYVKD